MKRFSAGFLISVSLSATDLLCLIRNLIFSLLKFRLIAFKQFPPLLAIPMIWNHLVMSDTLYTKSHKAYDQILFFGGGGGAGVLPPHGRRSRGGCSPPSFCQILAKSPFLASNFSISMPTAPSRSSQPPHFQIHSAVYAPSVSALPIRTILAFTHPHKSFDRAQVSFKLFEWSLF